MLDNNPIKEAVKKQYARIAVTGNSDSCCMPGECCATTSPVDAAKTIGYDASDLDLVPEASVLGVGCGAPLNYAGISQGEAVVDLGSGAGIDVFMAANKVGENGSVIGIDMTDEMLEKARKNASLNDYSNVEFRKGDIESDLPIADNSVDLVISNCVINLTSDKTEAFRQVYRVLKNGGRMVISDLTTDKEIAADSVNAQKWCSCIDGALTRENYLESIRKAGFADPQVLQERIYLHGDEVGGRTITGVIIKAIKN